MMLSIIERFLCLKGLVKRSRRVNVEIVKDKPNLGGSGKPLIGETLEPVSEVGIGTSLGDFNVPPPQLRLKRHEEIAEPASRLSGCCPIQLFFGFRAGLGLSPRAKL